MAKTYGGTFERGFDSAVNGFSAVGLSLAEAKRIAAGPAVEKVVQSHRLSVVATQDDPPSWGIDRIDQETAPSTASTRTPTLRARASPRTSSTPESVSV